jgi:uncharacterized protein YbbK (DUF523 family)
MAAEDVSLDTCRARHIPRGGRVLVSACLLGLHTRYAGDSKECLHVVDFLHTMDLIPIPVCPEQLGGLPTPRAPSAFVHGDGQALLDQHAYLQDRNGLETTRAFLHGARQCLEIARLCRCKWAIFKERSPSCGVCQVYLRDDTDSGEQTLISGRGVTTALLERSGVRIVSEAQIAAISHTGHEHAAGQAKHREDG